jgi:anion-transporting  ArsA/GET3 family ATPase
MPSITEITDGRGICICAGSGGVGKTTTSAAIAAGSPPGSEGRRATIDPAKRLADSLGLKELENEPRRVDPKLFEAPASRCAGALGDDARRQGDLRRRRPQARAGRRDPRPDPRERIYRQLSTRWRAPRSTWRWKLFEIHQEGLYDFLVLDTPPSRNALDFLDAPKRLTQFIEGAACRCSSRPASPPAWSGGELDGIRCAQADHGIDLLSDLSEFFQAFSGMVDGFQERAKRVNELLADPATSFMVVCGPAGEPIEEAVYFHRKLVEAKLPVGGVIVNKVHYETEADLESGEVQDDLNGLLDDEPPSGSRTTSRTTRRSPSATLATWSGWRVSYRPGA